MERLKLCISAIMKELGKSNRTGLEMLNVNASMTFGITNYLYYTGVVLNTSIASRVSFTRGPPFGTTESAWRISHVFPTCATQSPPPRLPVQNRLLA